MWTLSLRSVRSQGETEKTMDSGVNRRAGARRDDDLDRRRTPAPRCGPWRRIGEGRDLEEGCDSGNDLAMD